MPVKSTAELILGQYYSYAHHRDHRASLSLCILGRIPSKDSGQYSGSHWTNCVVGKFTSGEKVFGHGLMLGDKTSQLCLPLSRLYSPEQSTGLQESVCPHPENTLCLQLSDLTPNVQHVENSSSKELETCHIRGLIILHKEVCD